MLYLKNLFFILLLTSLSFSQYGQGRPGKGKPGGCEISGFIIIYNFSLWLLLRRIFNIGFFVKYLPNNKINAKSTLIIVGFM